MKYKTIFRNTVKIIFTFSFFNLIFTNVIYTQVPTIFAKGPVVSKSGIFNSQKMDSVITLYVNKDSLINDEKTNKCETFKFGYAFDVDYGLSFGSWDKTKANGKVWKLKIISKNAYSINLIFDKLYLPQDASLYIYNEERTMVFGPVTSANCNDSGMYASDVIIGESIILEYFEPYNTIRNGQIHISKVIYGYKDIFNAKNNAKGYGDAEDCEIDINCPEGDDWCVESRAVAMILKNENTEWCSGAMINNVKEDLKPYFLTANHCLGDDGVDPNTALFRFHYKNPYCDADSYYGIYWTFTGFTLRANASISDFALLELNNYNANNNMDRMSGVHFAGWTKSDNSPNSTTGIHHPSGDVMKIHFDYNPAVSNQDIINWYGGTTSEVDTHWETYIDAGAMEGGSSGSPAFNDNHKIVGQLHGGTKGCVNNKRAYYGRFDISWALGLKAWLDPENTGIVEVDAISPPIIYHNKTITGGPHLYTATHEMELAGNISGYPNMPPNWPTNAWPFPENNQPFVVEQGANVEFKAGKRIVIKPGTQVKEGATARGYIAPVSCADGLSYSSFASDVENNYKLQTLDSIIKLNINEPLNESIYFSSYPNPFNNIINFEFETPYSSNINIYITDSYGQKIRQVYKKYTIAGTYQFEVDCSALNPAIYFGIIETQSERKIIKIVKI